MGSNDSKPSEELGLGLVLGQIQAELTRVREGGESLAAKMDRLADGHRVLTNEVHQLRARVTHAEERAQRAEDSATAARASVSEHMQSVRTESAAVVEHIRKLETTTKVIAADNHKQSTSIAAVAAETNKQTPLIQKSPRLALIAAFVGVVLAHLFTEIARAFSP